MISIYLSTAIGLTPGGNSTLHIDTQTVNRTTQITTEQHKEECGPCPVFASFTLAFALRLRKKHGKTSVRVAGEYPHITKHTHTHYKTHTHITKHTLQNNIKPPQYKLKQTQNKIHANEIVPI